MTRRRAVTHPKIDKRQESAMPKPDFLGIGAQRAGTTFLHTVLSRHPQIAMPRTGTDSWNKEQHFFNKHVLSSDLNGYEKQFENIEEPGIRISGEITPAYSALPDYLIRTVESYLARERTRIILVIRNPVYRVISSYKLFARKRGERGRQRRARSLWRFIVYAERPGVAARTDYLATINNWTAIYGPGRLLILVFDELTAQPVDTLRQIARFLDVDPEYLSTDTVSPGKVHASPDDDVPPGAGCYVAWRWLPMIRQLNDELEGDLDSWVAEMEEKSARLGPWRRVAFNILRPAARAWNVGQRRRMRRRFRRIDARLQRLVSARS